MGTRRLIVQGIRHSNGQDNGGNRRQRHIVIDRTAQMDECGLKRHQTGDQQGNGATVDAAPGQKQRNHGNNAQQRRTEPTGEDQRITRQCHVNGRIAVAGMRAVRNGLA